MALDIQIYENNNKHLVSIRDLHRIMEVSIQFSIWANRALEKYEEGVDYWKEETNSVSVGRPAVDYKITIGVAKEIAMAQNTEKGLLVRKYFRDCEEKFTGGDIAVKNLQPEMESTYALIKAMNQTFIRQNEMMAQLREVEKEAQETRRLIQNTNESVNALSRRIDVRPPSGSMTFTSIAERMGFLSKSRKPHANFVKACAKAAGLKVSTNTLYNNESTCCIATPYNGRVSNMVFIKPIAIPVVEQWIMNELPQYIRIEYYLRKTGNHEIGDPKDQFADIPISRSQVATFSFRQINPPAEFDLGLENQDEF